MVADRDLGQRPVGLPQPGSLTARHPAPIRSHGTGYLITLTGYLITNGHVVQPYHESNEREQREALLRQAVEQTCLATSLPEKQKRQAVSGLLVRLAPSATVELKKKLTVVLPNRETFAADVKAYSPPLADRPGKQGSTDGGPATESGKDLAILKIDARNLPTAALGNSDRVQLGQSIHLLGFPGVVLYHDLLDKRSAVEASVTSGRISSVKLDARGAPVIQTDAAASWGNSGGPAINEQGEVIGILTFISLTSDETQAIQGFNFLVPVNMVREFARTAGAVLGVPSPFNAVWREAVEKFGREDWAGAQTKLDAAARLVPNLPDVQRLQAETELRLLQASRWPSPWTLGGSSWPSWPLPAAPGGDGGAGANLPRLPGSWRRRRHRRRRPRTLSGSLRRISPGRSARGRTWSWWTSASHRTIRAAPSRRRAPFGRVRRMSSRPVPPWHANRRSSYTAAPRARQPASRPRGD